MTRNRLLYHLLRGLAAVLPVVSTRVAYRLARFVSFVAYLAVRPARRALLLNLSVVTGLPTTSARVRRAARHAFEVNALNWVDTLRLKQLSADEIIGLVDVEGWHHLVEAVESDRGVILIAMHLGNFDLVGQYIEAKGYHVVIPVERVEPPELFDFLTDLRRSKGVNLVPLDRAPRAMLKALRGRGIVAIAGDRRVAGKGVRVEFCGKPASLPVGPAELARREGCRMVLAVGIRRKDGGFTGLIRPIRLDFTDEEEIDDRANTARMADVMTDVVREFPDQWMAFSPVWDGDTADGAADRIRRRHAAGR